jgi:Protein of unknown function (DUF3592)
MSHLIAPIGMLLMAGGISFFLFAKRLRQMSWAYCPVTQATIRSFEVSQGEGRKPYSAKVVYDYGVGDEHYFGCLKRSFPTEQLAREFVDYCQSRRLTARYRPENPCESSLF